MVDTENRFHQFLTGYLDTKTRQGRMQMLPTMVSLPIFPVWRQSFGGQSRAADILDLIDSIYATAKEQGGNNG